MDNWDSLCYYRCTKATPLTSKRTTNAIGHILPIFHSQFFNSSKNNCCNLANSWLGHFSIKHPQSSETFFQSYCNPTKLLWTGIKFLVYVSRNNRIKWTTKNSDWIYIPNLIDNVIFFDLLSINYFGFSYTLLLVTPKYSTRLLFCSSNSLIL